MNINRITIIGFTGKDARHRSTQNGKSVTKLSVATTKRYRDAEGKWQEKTQWTAAWRMGLLRSMPPTFNKARSCSWKAK